MVWTTFTAPMNVGEKLTSFGLTLAIFYDNSQIFIVERDQILKDNLAIWSHCLEPFLTKPVLTIQLAHKIFSEFCHF